MDVVIVLGPLVACILALLNTVRIHWPGDGESLLTLSVRRVGVGQYLILLVSAALFALFVGYIVVENLPCILGLRPSC